MDTNLRLALHKKKGWGHEGPPYLSLFEIEQLIASCPEEHQLCIRLIAYTGCRVSEILRLTGKDIDWDRQELKVSASKSKSDKFKFVIVHDPLTWGLLVKYAKDKTGQLFPYTRQRIWQVINGAGNKIGIRGLHPHTLRNSFGVAWAKSGGELTFLQRQLGHASYNTTVKYYLKFRTSDIAEEGLKLKREIMRIRQKFNLPKILLRHY